MKQTIQIAHTWTAALVLTLTGSVRADQEAPPAERPNIVLIVADDLGFSDLGCYGGEIETPNLDRLARGGLRFTQFYNNAICVATRASMMTGLYSQQVGGHALKDCVTIVEVLRAAGYRTLMAGKWHLSGHPRQHTRYSARPRRVVPHGRSAVGQPQQHTLSAFQTLESRRRHLYPRNCLLAGGDNKARPDHARRRPRHRRHGHLRGYRRCGVSGLAQRPQAILTGRPPFFAAKRKTTIRSTMNWPSTRRSCEPAATALARRCAGPAHPGQVTAQGHPAS